MSEDESESKHDQVLPQLKDSKLLALPFHASESTGLGSDAGGHLATVTSSFDEGRVPYESPISKAAKFPDSISYSCTRIARESVSMTGERGCSA